MIGPALMFCLALARGGIGPGQLVHRNLLANPGFDRDLSHWRSGPAGPQWAAGSARLHRNEELLQCVAAEQLRNYAFGGAVRLISAKPARATITVKFVSVPDCRQVDADTIVAEDQVTATANGTWQSLKQTVPSAPATQSALVRLTVEGDPDVLADFDDLFFTPGLKLVPTRPLRAADYERVKEGMTFDEVVSLAGPPDTISGIKEKLAIYRYTAATTAHRPTLGLYVYLWFDEGRRLKKKEVIAR